MKKVLRLLSGVVPLVLMLGCIVIKSRDEPDVVKEREAIGRENLVKAREAVNAAFAELDLFLARRNDLIPPLVDVVRGFAGQEQAAIDLITNARAAMMNAKTPKEKIDAAAQTRSALSRLFVVVENYPNIKSNETFLRLQDELAGTENRLAVQGQRYNGAVQQYNSDLERSPNHIAAAKFGFKRNEAYFPIDGAAKQVPKVRY